MPYDPRTLLAQIRAKDGSGVFVMVVRGQHVANVVQERSRDPVTVRPVEPSSCRTLKRMLAPADTVGRRCIIQHLKSCEEALTYSLR